MITSSLTALVVENEKLKSGRLAKLLSSFSQPFVETRIAENLSEGVSFLQSSEVDIVFTSLSLPSSKTLEGLVTFHRDAKEVPIIALLDREELEVVQDVAQSLADDCLFWDELDSEGLRRSIDLAFDRRQMLKELHAPATNDSDSETSFQLLLNRIDEALLVVSREDRRLLFINDVASDTFGQDINNICHEIIDFGVLDEESVELVTVMSHPAARNAELRSTWLDWEGIPACMITLRDISKRKRAEDAFLGSQRRLELALKASNIGMWSWDLRTNRLSFSERWKHMLGYDGNEFSDTPSGFRSSLHPDDRDSVAKRFLSYLRDPWPDFECEYRMRHKNGSFQHIFCRAELFSDADGKLSKMIGSHIDITERKKQEAAKALVERQLQAHQRFESLGSLAGGMAHCMNNLITSMLGNVSILREEAEESGMSTERIQKIDYCSRQAAELCQKLLSFSGKGTFVSQALQLNEMIFDCKEIIEISLAKGSEVDFQLEEALPDIVADRSEMQQLLLNLVMNASEATDEEESPSLSIKTGLREFNEQSLDRIADKMNAMPGAYVYLEIKDNGCGMSPDVAEQAFEPFFTTKFKGRGLGLSAVKGIVMAAGGLIEVESEVGVGSRIRVYFPCSDTPPQAAKPADNRKRKALIAEDEEILRKVMTSMISSFGYEPILAEDGRVALQLYEENCDELAIALIDLNMPRMNGARLFQAIRSQCQHLPIILMSGDDDEVAIPFEDCEQERCRFLQKPFGMQELKRIMGSLIDTRTDSLVVSS